MRLNKREQWREAQAAFYVSGAWIDCARAYREAHPLCERCLAKREISVAEQVHHKIRLAPENINDPSVLGQSGGAVREMPQGGAQEDAAAEMERGR